MGNKMTFLVDNKNVWSLQSIDWQVEKVFVPSSISVHDWEVDEFLDEQCESCQELLYYSDFYDALYCRKCDEWQEEMCDDLTCEYCQKRPHRPSEQE